ncbi:GntR family transcriptional regulator [Streptomyces sp. 6N223]|uniref:GntR family transcriptional regulator n=1 Tax=Streptomyces sp. 6N223 TaxID=3457412 RepID=UPI003FD0A3E5
MSDSEWVSSSTPYLTPRGLGQPDAWSAETASQGRRGTQRIVHAGEVPAPAEVADLLAVPHDQPVIVRRRIMYLDDQPCELTDTYYPLHIAGGTPLAGKAKIRGGAVTLLARLGHVGVHVREDVTAGMPNEEERDALLTGQNEAVLRLTRLTMDDDRRPIQVDMMVMPAQRQRLRYERRMG